MCVCASPCTGCGQCHAQGRTLAEPHGHCPSAQATHPWAGVHGHGHPPGTSIHTHTHPGHVYTHTPTHPYPVHTSCPSTHPFTHLHVPRTRACTSARTSLRLRSHACTHTPSAQAPLRTCTGPRTPTPTPARSQVHGHTRGTSRPARAHPWAAGRARLRLLSGPRCTCLWGWWLRAAGAAARSSQRGSPAPPGGAGLGAQGLGGETAHPGAPSACCPPCVAGLGAEWVPWGVLWWRATLGSPTSCSLGSWQGASGVDPAPFIHGCRAEPGPLPQAKGAGSSTWRLPQQPSVSKSWLSSHPPWCTWAVMGTNPSSGGDRPRHTSRSPQLLEALGNLRGPRDQITLSWVGVKCSSSWFIPSRMWGLWGTSSILLQPPVPGFRAW